MKFILSLILFFAIMPCSWASDSNEEAFNRTLDKHLNAVVNRDLVALKSTMTSKITQARSKNPLIQSEYE